MTNNKLTDGKFSRERLIDWAVVAVAEAKQRVRDYPESVEAAAGVCLAEIALAALTAPQLLTDAEREELQERRKADPLSNEERKELERLRNEDMLRKHVAGTADAT